MQHPFELSQVLHVGSVEHVAPDYVRVVLDIDAPEAAALNAGSPRAFPRVNEYLLVPVDDSYLVGQVEWLTVEHSAFPQRRGMRDFGLIDLPFPLRKLRLNPLGTIALSRDADEYTFYRGISALPSVGAAAMLPTDRQLQAIVGIAPNRRIKIGVSPLAGDADVSVDPNQLFGRHLAVLGNTGSGKSCSVAGLVRWSIDAAAKAIDASPNSRFIVLDPNGEYERAFSSGLAQKVKVFRVGDPAPGESLSVPAWLWNSAEWSAFAQASPGV